MHHLKHLTCRLAAAPQAADAALKPLFSSPPSPIPIWPNPHYQYRRYVNAFNPMRTVTLRTSAFDKDDMRSDAAFVAHPVSSPAPSEVESTIPRRRDQPMKRFRSPAIHAPSRPCSTSTAGTPQRPHDTDLITVSHDHVSITDIPDHRLSFSLLRDECTCVLCIDPSTRQKTHTSGQAHQSAIKGAPHIKLSPEGLNVTWADDHRSMYTFTQLRNMALGVVFGDGQLYHALDRKLWNTPERLNASSDLRLDYAELQTEQGLWRALRQAQRFGVLLIRGVPTENTDDRACELRKLASRIGQIRDTFYGQTWNVKSMPNSKNVAYTDLDLGLHMDLL
jgi:hypothetical protein